MNKFETCREYYCYITNLALLSDPCHTIEWDIRDGILTSMYNVNIYFQTTFPIFSSVLKNYQMKSEIFIAQYNLFQI